MPRKTSRPTDPWAAMDALMAAGDSPTGPGWFTREDFQKRYDLSSSGAWGRLKTLMQAGKLDTWEGVLPNRHHGTMFKLKP